MSNQNTLLGPPISMSHSPAMSAATTTTQVNTNSDRDRYRYDSHSLSSSHLNMVDVVAEEEEETYLDPSDRQQLSETEYSGHSSDETANGNGNGNGLRGPVHSDPTENTFSQDGLKVNAPETIKTTMQEGKMSNNLGPAAEAAAGGPGGLGGAEGPGGAGGPGPGAGPGAQWGGGGRPKLNKFAYSLFAPEIAHFRKIIVKILGMTVVVMIILMWSCLPLYWGSLWKANKYTNKLTVRVIDRDGGAIGSFVSQGLLSQTNLRYFVTSPAEFPTDADVEYDLVQEGAWAAIVIQPGATNALALARSIGDMTYNGSNAIYMLYPQARQENAIGTYLLPYTSMALGQITGRYSAQSASQYISANVNNITAMNLLASAPGTISASVGYTTINIRPWNQPVATAITLVGLIYMVIFAFSLTMANAACREIISPFLTTRAYILYRLIAPMCLYSVVSLLFVMVSLPFKVHFGAHYTYGGGFFLWWFSLYLGMAAVGLATEFAITILTPKFIAYFLIAWIIVNASVVTLPHELQPWIYKYGAATPFYNASRIIRTIIFNTKNDVAMNIGILLAWVVLSLLTISLATWLQRRKSVIAHHKAMAEKARNEKQA